MQQTRERRNSMVKTGRRNSVERLGRARRNSLVALQDAAETYAMDMAVLEAKMGAVRLHGWLDKKTGAKVDEALEMAIDRELPQQTSAAAGGRRQRRRSLSKIAKGRRPSIGDADLKWNRRFFVLQGNCLLYFREPKDFLYFVQGKGQVTPRGSIPLAGASITISRPKRGNKSQGAGTPVKDHAVAGHSDEQKRKAKSTQHPCRFRLNAHFEDGFRQVTMRAESVEDMQDWVEEIKEAIVALETADDSAFYRRMPKVELHAHLIGSLRRTTLLDYARKFGVPTGENELGRTCSEAESQLLNKFVGADGELLVTVPSQSAVAPPEIAPSVEGGPKLMKKPQKSKKSRASARRGTNDMFASAAIARTFGSAGSDLEKLTEDIWSNGEQQLDAEDIVDERHKHYIILDVATQVFRTAAIVHRCTLEALEDFAADNVIYVELRVSPRAEAALTPKEFLDTILSACAEAKTKWDIESALIVSIDRAKSLSTAKELVELAGTYRKAGKPVVGVELSGDPRRVGVVAALKSAFETAKMHGLRLSLSLAELHWGATTEEGEKALADGVEIFALEPDRLCHATHLLDDSVLWPNYGGPLLSFPIPIEITVTSDLMCGTVNEVEDHPFKELRELRTAGGTGGKRYPLVVGSDHPGVFPRCRTSDEYAKIAAAFKLPRGEMLQLSAAAVDHIFCDESTAQNVRTRLYAALAALDPTTLAQAAARNSDSGTQMGSRSRRTRRGSVGAIFNSMLTAAANAGSVAAGAALTSGLAAGRPVATMAGKLQAGTETKMSAIKTKGARKLATAMKNKYHDQNVSVEQLFLEGDDDHNGTLDLNEFKLMAERMGVHLHRDEAAKAMAEIDADGDGKVSLAEFDAFVENSLDIIDILETEADILAEAGLSNALGQQGLAVQEFGATVDAVSLNTVHISSTETALDASHAKGLDRLFVMQQVHEMQKLLERGGSQVDAARQLMESTMRTAGPIADRGLAVAKSILSQQTTELLDEIAKATVSHDGATAWGSNGQVETVKALVNMLVTSLPHHKLPSKQILMQEQALALEKLQNDGVSSTTVQSMLETLSTADVENAVDSGDNVPTHITFFHSQIASIWQLLGSGTNDAVAVGRKLLDVQMKMVKVTLDSLNVVEAKTLLMQQMSVLQTVAAGAGSEAATAQGMLRQYVQQLMSGMIGGPGDQVAVGKSLLLGKVNAVAGRLDAKIAKGGIAGKLLSEGQKLLESLAANLEQLDSASVYAKLQEMTAGGLESATDVLLADAEALVIEGKLTEEQLGVVLVAGLEEAQVNKLKEGGHAEIVMDAVPRMSPNQFLLLLNADDNASLTHKQKNALLQTGVKIFLQRTLSGGGGSAKLLDAVVGKGGPLGILSRINGGWTNPKSGGSGFNQIKVMAMKYMVEAVKTADIPPIHGELDSKGGFYDLRDIGVSHFTVPEPNVEVKLHGLSGHISASNLGLRTDDFTFSFEKRTFPKFKDTGKAFLSIQNFGIKVEFDIVKAHAFDTTGDGHYDTVHTGPLEEVSHGIGENGEMTTTLQADHLRITLQLDELVIIVTEGNHKKLYNRIMSVVKFVVRSFIVKAINKALNKQLGPLLQKLNGLIVSSGADKHIEKLITVAEDKGVLLEKSAMDSHISKTKQATSAAKKKAKKTAKKQAGQKARVLNPMLLESKGVGHDDTIQTRQSTEDARADRRYARGRMTNNPMLEEEQGHDWEDAID